MEEYGSTQGLGAEDSVVKALLDECIKLESEVEVLRTQIAEAKTSLVATNDDQEEEETELDRAFSFVSVNRAKTMPPAAKR